MRREIFELEICEIDCDDKLGFYARRIAAENVATIATSLSTSNSVLAATISKEYKLQFPHLLDTPVSKVNSDFHRQNLGHTDKLSVGINRNSTSCTAGNSTHLGSALLATGDLADSHQSADDYQKRSKKDKKLKRRLGSISTVIANSTIDIDGSAESATTTIPAAASTMLPSVMHPSLPGPPHMCQPTWPSFISNYNICEKVRNKLLLSLQQGLLVTN